MLTVSQDFKTACLNYPIHNELDICVVGAGENNSDLHIYNSNIVSESMKIEQSVCDEADIKFGGAISSSFEIDVFGVPDLTGKRIKVTITQSVAIPLYPGMAYPNENIYPGRKVLSETFKVFTGNVFSCKLNKNHITRKIVAYDDLYWIGKVNCAEWYDSIQHKVYSHIDPTQVLYKYTTVYELRKALCTKYGIVEQYPNDVLPTDNIDIEKADGIITVAEILRCICELSGVFCYLNGDGKLEYHTISTNENIPDNIRKPGAESYGFNYSDCSFEEYQRQLAGMYHRAQDGTVNWFGWGDVGSPEMYFLEGNSVVDAYDGFTSWSHEIGVEEDGVQIWQKIYNNLNFTPYRPMTLKTPCRLWVQLGDKLTFKVHSYEMNGDLLTSTEEEITSYVLSRRITGIQALNDEFTANAENVKYTERDYEE